MIEVGFEFTQYAVVERGMIELCVIVSNHFNGAPRPFALNLTTENGHAGTCV